ncbi:MAG: hypothetical protein WC119_01445 [Synergistaceae bacterium]
MNRIVTLNPSDPKYKSNLCRILFWAKKIRALNILGGKCSICGNDDIFVLEFHHINSKDKLFSINRGRRMAWSELEKEIMKCVIMCRNCHAESIGRNSNAKDNRHLFVKEKLLEYKNVFKCERCGFHGKNNKSLDFHHKSSEEKTFNIMAEAHQKERSRKKSLSEKVAIELDKCEVICRNCHAKIHADYIWFKMFSANIYDKVDNMVEKPRVDKKEVLKLYKKGYSGYYIAKALGISFCATYGIINNERS